MLLNKIELEESEKLENENREAICTEKYIQIIKENSQELKDLEGKLREAYLNKERSVQMQTKILELKQTQVINIKSLLDFYD